jgi:hypothetical protein
MKGGEFAYSSMSQVNERQVKILISRKKDKCTPQVDIKYRIYGF